MNTDSFERFRAKVELIRYVYLFGLPARNAYGDQAYPKPWKPQPIRDGLKPDNDNLSYLHW